MFVQENFLAICAIFCVSIVSVFASYIIYLEFFAFRYPKNLPSIGFRNELFARSRASIRQLMESPRLVEEGYKQYGHSQSFVVPHASFRPQVMLPPQHIKWLVTQPEAILNSQVVRMDRQGIDYFPLSTDSKTNLMAAHKIIAEGLNRYLDIMQPQLHDGVRHSIEKSLGTDSDEWREFPLMDAVSYFLDAIVCRVMFGETLSRDEGFLKMMRYFMVGAGVLTEIVGQIPFGMLRPIFGFPASWFTMVVKKISIRYLLPFIKERQKKVDNEGGGKPEPEDYDFITQCIRIVRKLKFPIGIDEDDFIGDILMFIALAAVISTRTTTVNAMLDILGPGAKDDTYEALREEAESLIKSESDWNDPSILKNMVKIDSALRESARVNPLQTRGLLKQVMPKGGLDLPDGTHVPQGTWLGVPIEAIHRDEKNYPNPLEFDALRFSTAESDESSKSLAFAQQSDTYMFFSYGRTVCPGRWFATRVMKMVIAYVTFHYEIKPLEEHPQRFSFGDTKLHHTSLKMVVRRRRVSEKSH